jgi:hypothetical protein
LAKNTTPADRAGTPSVAIVDEQFANALFGDASPIGRTFRYQGGAGEPDPIFEIVGLVKNTTYSEVREETRAIAFLPLAQDGSPRGQATLVARARGSFAGVMQGIQRQMAEVDARLLVDFHVLDAEIAESLLRERLVANLSGGFGLLAVTLSMLGLYGVMSYMVARRRSEIGVRMALGAQSTDILRLVLREVGQPLVLGLVLGLTGALLLSRYAESLLYGLAPNDAVTLALAGTLLAATALAAAVLPARRAAGLDAAVVLRSA